MVERAIARVTRPAVLAAIAEYDRLGQTAFLAKYGYRRARTYRVWHEGHPYDSKAIVGVAFGYLQGRPPPLTYDEFSGGLAYVVPLLKRLGFSFHPPSSPDTVTGPRPRIFASSVWGSDLDKWGAWGFADRGTRDKLAAIIAPGDFVLSIGTMGPETPPNEQGRLLALMTIGSELIETRELVEPDFYQQSIDTNGRERWPYGFPIKTAERFSPTPLRTAILPRITEQNLHRVLARHYVELSEEEVVAVLALPRVAETNVYSTPVSQFAARLRRPRAGPPPAKGQRVLTAASGPAATYVMALRGSAVAAVAQPLQLEALHGIYKVGFSNDPQRRLRELNAYLPCDESLCWTQVLVQWHDDEINAWAMEQHVFHLLAATPVIRFKGEMIAGDRAPIDMAWQAALKSTPRPTKPVVIETGNS